MCGLFGAFGQTIDPAIINELALLNRARGTDSLGFFDSNGRVAKLVGDPKDILDQFQPFIHNENKWFIAGHTRFATRGDVTTHNAHPFRIGHIICAHNGCVGAPQRYRVDSLYLVHLLARQKKLENCSGYWALSYTDEENFYLRTYANEVAYVKYDGNWYYSSDYAHLEQVIPKASNILSNCILKVTPDLKLYMQHTPISYTRYYFPTATTAKTTYTRYEDDYESYRYWVKCHCCKQYVPSHDAEPVKYRGAQGKIEERHYCYACLKDYFYDLEGIDKVCHK